MGWLDYTSFGGTDYTGDNNLWGDLFSTNGGDTSSFADWGTGVGQSSSSGGWLSTIGKLFGGGSSGSSSGGVNWSQALLSGLGSAADASMSKANTKDAAEETGKQQRKTAAFAADLQDYYGQVGKQRKRYALDTYGQFSLTSRYAPNMVHSPAVQVPSKPNPGGY